MTDIGPTLREARMRDGRDIAEFEDRTKIRAKYLRALENEEWSLLPGPAFTKGFLHSYASALGLDGRLLVDEYKRQWEEPHELDIVPVRPTVGIELREERAARTRLRRWVALAVLVVIIALAFLLVGRLGFGSSTPPPPTTATGLGASGSSGATTSLVASCTPAGGRLPDGCLSVRIEPLAALYVCLVADKRIRIDGRRLDATSGAPTFHGRDFVVTLGSSAAALIVNGRRFALPRSGGPVRYVLSAHSRRRVRAPTRLTCTT
jgi:hypothetical protein